MKFKVGDIIEVLKESPFFGVTFLVSSGKKPDYYYLIPISNIPEKLQHFDAKTGVVDIWSIDCVEGCMRRIS